MAAGCAGLRHAGVRLQLRRPGGGGDDADEAAPLAVPPLPAGDDRHRAHTQAGRRYGHGAGEEGCSLTSFTGTTPLRGGGRGGEFLY